MICAWRSTVVWADCACSLFCCVCCVRILPSMAVPGLCSFLCLEHLADEAVLPAAGVPPWPSWNNEDGGGERRVYIRLTACTSAATKARASHPTGFPPVASTPCRGICSSLQNSTGPEQSRSTVQVACAHSEKPVAVRGFHVSCVHA